MAQPAMQADLAGGDAARFYRQHGIGPVWSGSPQADADARLALAVLARAGEEGLDPSRYQIAADPAARDAMLTKAVLTYMRDLSVGRPELRALDADVALPPPALDVAALLEQALQRHDLAAMFAQLAPPYADYAFLKAQLARAPDDTTRDTVLANMERWRWMPRQMEADRIVINAADASLQMWLGGRAILDSRVIVGRPHDPTPILRAEGAGITVNPPWTVPHSIAAREILPKLKRNSAYLASQDMVLLDGPPGDPQGLHVNWKAIRAGTFPYRIRQYPGPRNPLGRVKLELPNRFDVYLHDTPGKAAFNRPSRDASHGCVRVEQILPLASYALSADLGAVQKITDAIAAGQTSYLPLHKRLPIYFLYWTAFEGPGGELELRPDIYGRDARLLSALETRPQQVASAAEPVCMKG